MPFNNFRIKRKQSNSFVTRVIVCAPIDRFQLLYICLLTLSDRWVLIKTPLIFLMRSIEMPPIQWMALLCAPAEKKNGSEISNTIDSDQMQINGELFCIYTCQNDWIVNARRFFYFIEDTCCLFNENWHRPEKTATKQIA